MAVPTQRRATQYPVFLTRKPRAIPAGIGSSRGRSCAAKMRDFAAFFYVRIAFSSVRISKLSLQTSHFARRPLY